MTFALRHRATYRSYPHGGLPPLELLGHEKARRIHTPITGPSDSTSHEKTSKHRCASVCVYGVGGFQQALCSHASNLRSSSLLAKCPLELRWMSVSVASLIEMPDSVPQIDRYLRKCTDGIGPGFTAGITRLRSKTSVLFKPERYYPLLPETAKWRRHSHLDRLLQR